MLPAVFGRAVLACHQHTQAPLELVFASALGAAALACQEGFDVLRPTGNTSPLSLFLLTIAESGERKTTVDNYFQASIQKIEHARLQKQKFDALDRNGVRYESVLKAWEIRQAEQVRKFRKALRDDVPIDKLKEFVMGLDQGRPSAPQDARMVFMNSTLEAILEALAAPTRAIGLISDEGGVVLDSRVSQHLSSLNVLWEGGSIHVDRVSKPSFHISNARLTISIMSQPGMFRRFIWKRNSEARDLGFLARALTCYPQSTQGRRQVLPAEGLPSVDVDFHARIEGVMRVRRPGASREKLSFDADAAGLWVNFAQYVEDNLASNGYFSGVRDFGSKLADNVARLAGIFAFFSASPARPEKIDIDSVRSAIHVGMWYAQEFVRLFGSALQISEDYELGKLLAEFLSAKELEQRLQDGWYKASEVLQYGPPKLRKARALEQAIAYGGVHQMIELQHDGRTRLVRCKRARVPIVLGRI